MTKHVCGAIALLLSILCWADVPVNGLFETSIENSTSYSNKFRDVTLNATFTSPSGVDTPFWGFFDGDGTGGPGRMDIINNWQDDTCGEETGTTWKLRFMPTEAGTWTYTWSFSDGSHNGSGSFVCTETGKRPGILKRDNDYPRWVTNDEGYFYPVTIEMHYGEQVAYSIDEYRQQYDVYINKGFNMVSFLWLPVWDFNSWQVNPVNNSGVNDAWITIWYQTKNYTNGDSSAYDSDRMNLFTWKRLDQHLGYLADQGVYAFPFQGFNVKHSPEVLPHNFSDEKYDWYVRYAMARLAPYYNLIWNNTWESDNGFSKLIDGLDKYDPWRHLRTRVARSSGDTVDIYDGDRAPEDVPATSSKPWWIFENNGKTGLWGDSSGASGTALMDQDKVLDITWRYIVRSTPVYILEVQYTGYSNPTTHIAPNWNTYGQSAGIGYFGTSHQFIIDNTEYWKMSNDDSLVTGTNVYCLAQSGEQYLCYSKSGSDITLDAQAGSYDATWLDPKTGNTSTATLDLVAGDNTLTAPGSSYLVVYLKRSSGPNPGTLAFNSATSSVAEDGASIAITVKRNGGSSGAASIDWATADDSATAGSDYTAANGTVSWTDGDSASKTISITISDDSDYEGDESLTVSLSNVSGGSLGTPSTHTVTIVDNDSAPNQPPVASDASVTTDEDTAVAIPLTATDADGDPLTWSVGTPSHGALSGAAPNLTYTPTGGYSGPDSFTFTVNDGTVDSNTATVTITVDAVVSPGTLAFSATTASVNENAGTVTLTVSRTGGSDGAASVDFATADGTATAGQDYTAASATLNWANNDSATKTIVIDILDDAVTESDETFTVTLSNSTNGATIGTATATITINANDQYGVITLPVATADVTEGDSITVTVERNGGSQGEVSVYYETTHIDTDNGDYTAGSGTLTWADGNADDKTVVIDTTDDTDSESAEDFKLVLSSPTGGATIGNDMQTITILANDAAAGAIGLSVASVSIGENAGTLSITVSRTGDSDGAVSIDYATADDTATARADYGSESGTLSWADGNADDKTIEVTITDDSDYEGDETFTVTLSNISGGAVYGTQETVVTIVEDDAEPNNDPVITAGPNADPATVTIPAGVALDVTATDADGDPLSYAWSKQSGPGNVSFSAQSASTTATFNTAGNYTIQVVVTDGNGGSAGGTVDVAVNAAPVTGDGEIVVTGDTDFGATYVEDGSSARTFTIRNDGTGVLAILSVSLGGTDDAEFSVTVDPAASIAAGGSTTVELTFDPSSEGGKTATLTIVSDDPTDGTVVLNLTGEALAGSDPGVPPVDDDDDGCGIATGLSLASWLPMLMMLLGLYVRRRK